MKSQTPQTAAPNAQKVAWTTQASHAQVSQTPRKPEIRNTQKRGAKIGIRGFIIGCFLFLLFVFGVIGVGLYYIIQNPEEVGGNINIDTVKQGLQIFAVLFFWFLFFLGFGMIVVNAYRLSTKKEWSKVPNVFGLLLAIFIVGGSLGGGVVVLQNINNIAWSDSPRTSNIILAKVPTKVGPRYLHNSPGLQVIAPVSMTFELNRTVFDRTMLNTIQGNEIQRVALDCGNEQVINADLNSYQFAWSCLLTKKGNYPVQLIVTHVDRTNGVQQETVIPTGNLPVTSELSLSTSQGEYTLNDAKTEINVGKAPTKVLFDANKIFEDYGIAEYQIDWDIEGDGIWDKTDDVSFAHNYKKPGIMTLYYTITGLGEYVYQVNFRVGQNEVPICEITPQLIQDTTYNLPIACDDLGTPIVEYNYEIINIDRERTVTTEKTKRPTMRYTFTQWGDYVIRLTYLTNEGKKWFYESETISVGKVIHDVDYTISYKWVNDNDYQRVTQWGEGDVFSQEWNLVLTTLPVVLKVEIGAISPITNNTKSQVLFNGEPILSTDDKTFTFEVTTQGDQKLEIQVTESDDEEQATNILIPVILDQAQIIGSLEAIGGTVGFDPFEARFDATTTTLTDPEDEIIYFTWDFGDGEVKKNTSQGTIKHTYIYDLEKENGEYMPSVTIKTKKWLEETIQLENPILVKKRSIKATIRSDSHISQIAGRGETITLSLTTDGDPSTIIWDFGDGNTLECNGRSCLEPTINYEEAGEYTIKADITFSDGNETITDGLKMIIEDE